MLELAREISYHIKQNETADVDSFCTDAGTHVSEQLEEWIKSHSIEDTTELLSHIEYEDQGAFNDLVWTSFFNANVAYPWSNSDSDVIADPVLYIPERMI